MENEQVRTREGGKIAPLFEAEYRLTEAEWRACYQRTRAKSPSRTKTAVRLSLLGLLGAGFIVYYVAVEPSGMSLFLGVLCALLAVMVYAAPILEERRAIRLAAENPRPTRVRELADGLAFGTDDGFLEQSFSALTLTAYPDMVIVGLPGDQRLAIPRRALDDAAWERLCARATQRRGETD